MRIRIYLLAIVALYSACLFAFGSAPDTSRFRLRAEAGWSDFDQGNFEAALGVADSLLTLPETPANGKWLAYVAHLRAVCLYSLLRDEEAIEAYHRTRALKQRYHRPYDLYWHSREMSTLYRTTKQYQPAGLYLDSAYLHLDTSMVLNHFELLRDHGCLLDVQKACEQSLPIRRKAVKLAQRLDTVNQMWAYYDLAYTLAYLRKYEEARTQLLRAQKLNKVFPHPELKWYITACLGICEVQLENYAVGAALLEEAVVLGQAFDQDICCGNLAYLAKALVHLGRFESARPHLTHAENQLPGIEPGELKINVLTGMIDAYARMERYADAHRLTRQLFELKDSLYAQEARAEVLRVEEHFRNRELQSELGHTQRANQRQRNWLTVLLAFSAVLFLVGGTLWYFYRRHAKLLRVVGIKNERLRRHDARRTAFFQNLAHELRPSLQLVRSPLDLLREVAVTTRERDLLGLASRSAERMDKLVEDLIAFGRLEVMDLPLRTTMVNLNMELQGLLRGFALLAAEKGGELRYSLEIPPQLKVEVDADRLGKIVSNLLDNALKYGNPEQGIEVNAEITGEVLSIWVRDRGAGVPREEAEAIFVRKHRVARDLELPGQGLGLAYARKLSEQMGGRIDYRDRAGGGAEFELQLPLTSIAPAESPGVDRPRTPGYTPADCQHLLIVEDDRQMQQYLRLIFEGVYRVDVVDNARAAREQLTAKRYDLLLTDYMLSGMNGLELVGMLREEQTGYRDMPVIVMSASRSPGLRQKAMASGADDLMAKPFDPEALKARIDNLLELRSIRRKHTVSTPTPTILTGEPAFVREVERTIRERMDDEQFSAQLLAKELHRSQRQLEREVKQATGFSPATLIRELRLQRAHDYLSFGEVGTVGEAMQRIGYRNQASFTRVFKKRYGVSPGRLLMRRKEIVVG